MRNKQPKPKLIAWNLAAVDKVCKALEKLATEHAETADLVEMVLRRAFAPPRQTKRQKRFLSPFSQGYRGLWCDS